MKRASSYVEIQLIAGVWRIDLVVPPQRFLVRECEDGDHACWLKKQLVHALKKIQKNASSAKRK